MISNCSSLPAKIPSRNPLSRTTWFCTLDIRHGSARHVGVAKHIEPDRFQSSLSFKVCIAPLVARREARQLTIARRHCRCPSRVLGVKLLVFTGPSTPGPDAPFPRGTVVHAIATRNVRDIGNVLAGVTKKVGGCHSASVAASVNSLRWRARSETDLPISARLPLSMLIKVYEFFSKQADRAAVCDHGEFVGSGMRKQTARRSTHRDSTRTYVFGMPRRLRSHRGRADADQTAFA